MGVIPWVCLAPHLAGDGLINEGSKPSGKPTTDLHSELYLTMSLPATNPTLSFWEYPPHRLASFRSPFPKVVDVAIIGSGITGSCIAKYLFEANPTFKIVMLDARKLCDGASGRNGGQCKPSNEPFSRR